MSGRCFLWQVGQRIGDPRPRARMRPSLVVMSHPLLQNSSQVSLIDRDQEIQAFAPHGADEAFAERVRLGCPKGRFQDSHSRRLQG